MVLQGGRERREGVKVMASYARSDGRHTRLLSAAKPPKCAVRTVLSIGADKDRWT